MSLDDDGQMFANNEHVAPEEIQAVLSYGSLTDGHPVANERLHDSGYVVPASSHVSKLSAADKRIRLFSEIRPREISSNNFGANPEVDYNERVSSALAREIVSTFNHPVVVRGIVASLNGGVANSSIAVRDIRHVLAEGSDRPGTSTLVAAISRHDGRPELNDHVNHALFSTPSSHLQTAVGTDTSRNLFPVLLVYDARGSAHSSDDVETRLTPGQRGYSANLPRDNEARRNVILAAYVLPKIERP